MSSNSSLDSCGFTLIELMVSLVIISVGMLALATMLITNISANMNSEQRIDHAVLAQSAMNRTVALVKAAPGYTQTAAQTALTGQFAAITDVTPTVTLNPSPTVAGTTTIITIQLQWSDKGQTRTLILRSAAVPE